MKDGLHLVPQECVLNRTQEQIVDAPLPPLMEAVVEVTPQECVLHSTQEQIMGVPVPQLAEIIVEVTPQERVQNRTPDQIAVIPEPQVDEECVQNRALKQTSGSLVPQTMDAVMEVLPPTPQESEENRVGEQIVDSVHRVTKAVVGSCDVLHYRSACKIVLGSFSWICQCP